MRKVWSYLLILAVAVFALVSEAPDGFAEKVKCNNFTFDGTKSKAQGRGKLTYNWDFGDGTKAEGSSVSHEYAKTWTYNATLTVDDGAGSACSTASDSVKVTLMKPPVADARVKNAARAIR